jgi:predicted RNA-binding Zn-ribbon protein involved in translation (DUF1610 family)
MASSRKYVHTLTLHEGCFVEIVVDGTLGPARLSWTDGVTGEWVEDYPSLSSALLRIAVLARCGETGWATGFVEGTAREFATTAEEFLRAHIDDPERQPSPPIVEDGGLTCPHCGSGEVRYLEQVPDWREVTDVRRDESGRLVVTIGDSSFGDGEAVGFACASCGEDLADPEPFDLTYG